MVLARQVSLKQSFQNVASQRIFKFPSGCSNGGYGVCLPVFYSFTSERGHMKGRGVEKLFFTFHQFPKIMIIKANLIILILASIISFTLQSPCKISVKCSCKGISNNIRSICLEEDIVDEPCSRWPGCVVCQKGKECQECSGDPSCTEATTHKGKFRQKRQNYVRPGYPANSMRQGSCPEMEPPKAGSVTCMTSSVKRSCTGSCIPGYRFENRESETEIELTCQNGAWTPLRRFPDCKSTGSCDLEVTGYGEFNCTSDVAGSHCDVICSRQYAGQFHCFPGRGWNPPLPGCVSQIGSPGITGSSGETRQPCRCQNGGRCDGNGRCICPEGRRGEFCEVGSPSTTGSSGETRRQPCRCQNGGRCDGNGQCICPEGRRGEFCEVEESPQIVYCANPGPMANGRKVYFPPLNKRTGERSEGNQDDPRFPQGGWLQYSCDDGYELDGEGVLTCETTGSWSSNRPFCMRESRPNLSSSVTCSNPFISIPNGRAVYLPAPNEGRRGPMPVPDEEDLPEGGRLQYACDEGYTLNGPETLTCDNTGFWSDIPPSCNNSR